MEYVLVTGGTGYIGSHICVELLFQGHKLIVVDNFTNSNAATLFKMRQLTGCSDDNLRFFKMDLREESALDDIVKGNKIYACIHLAGSKAVGESVANPLKYYDNNIGATITLLRVLNRNGVHRIIFSSSATVYGEPERVPIKEGDRLSAKNPYGRTKLYLESLLRDLAHSDSKWQVVLLRYFNPVGAHPSGLIGEDPHGVPNNLMPYLVEVASGKRSHLTVFGDDYETPDGTCLRDYIHVCDLADGHVAALDRLLTSAKAPISCVAVNLGTGKGTSVLELIHALESAINKPVPHIFGNKRSGDAAVAYCDPGFAAEFLGWKSKRGIREMCEDAWRFHTREI